MIHLLCAWHLVQYCFYICSYSISITQWERNSFDSLRRKRCGTGCRAQQNSVRWWWSLLWHTIFLVSIIRVHGSPPCQCIFTSWRPNAGARLHQTFSPSLSFFGTPMIPLQPLHLPACSSLVLTLWLQIHSSEPHIFFSLIFTPSVTLSLAHPAEILTKGSHGKYYLGQHFPIELSGNALFANVNTLVCK